MTLLSALRPTSRPTPVISSSELTRSFPRSGDHSSPRDAIIVDPQVTPGTSVPSHSRQCLQRLQEHHNLRFDLLVRSRNHQVMLLSNPHHLNENHSGATLVTRSGTFPETAVQNQPLQWNSRDTTSLRHGMTISSSWITRIPKTSRTSRSQMTGKSQIQRKLQQPQLSDRPDRRMEHAQRIRHPQDQRRPPHRQYRSRNLRHHLVLALLLQS